MSFGPPPSIYTQSALAADGERRKRRRRLSGALAAVVAVVLAVGGALFLAAGGDRSSGTQRAGAPAPDAVRQTVEKAPASPEGQVVVDHYEEDLPKESDPSPRYAPGTWATGKILAKGIGTRIIGVKIEPGADETAWSLQLDGHLCATTGHVTADGRTAVVVQPGKRKGTKDAGICDEVVFVDLNTGRKLWTATMPSAREAYVTNTNLTLADGVVAVAWGHGSVAYDMAHGARLWNSSTGARCVDKGFAGGGALLALESCGEGADTTYRVQRLAPRTGKPEWTYKVAAGVQDVYLPSADPPVLAVAAGDTLVTDLITLDSDDGGKLATIPMGGDAYAPRCGDRYFSAGFFGDIENCDGVVVGADRVFVTSKDQAQIGQPENWIVAFDRKTGRSEGKLDGRSLEPVVPLRMSGDRLLVLRGSLSDIEPSAVLSWDPRTGKQTPYLLFGLPSDDGGELSDPTRSDIVVEQGRVFFAKRELAADDKHPKEAVLSVLGIGSAGDG
ncbi:PQQ-binding-like beta-propeller repeat protein [Streptomyces sp. NPDC021562]|uniref:outer membrane protein assembly factor BamB family protein n=1 Tax=Streptomyces sp. NPDC021562 TaxID=3155121 RepID=UPI00340808CC